MAKRRWRDLIGGLFGRGAGPAADDEATAVKPAAAEAQAPKGRGGLAVNERHVARAKRKTDYTPFKPAIHPPAVTPTSGPTLAQDESLSAYASWANGSLNGAIAEGVTFLGYADLSVLAQRAEYRRISETIARHMARKWIDLKAKGEDDKTDVISRIEAEMTRLKVKDAFQKVAEQDGYFGRGHLYLDFGTSDDREELKTPIGDGRNDISKAKIGTGSLRRVKPIEAVWCYPTGYDSSDPLKPNWYRPDRWFVMGKEIHASRLLPFVGREVPDLLKPAYSFGGLSLSQMAKPYVDNWLRTRQSVADIVNAFSVMVLGTNLTDQLNANDGEDLFRRVDLFNNIRDNRGTMVIDKEKETFQNVSASLAGIDALQAQSQEHMAAVSGIPIVELLGIQPAGLNATSEGEIRVFYDWIHSCQEQLFRPNLERVLGFVQLSLFGAVDPDITFDFVPLWSLSEKEEAEKHLIEAQTDSVLVDAGILQPIDARKRIAADPDTPYAGLDVNDVPLPMPSELEPPEPGAMDAGEKEDEHWITKNGAHIRVSGEGEVVGGAGGRLDGTKLSGQSQAAKGGEQHPPNHVTEAHAKALNDYTGSGYRKINGHLRGGVPLDEQSQEHLKQLNDLLGSASLPEPTTVYRGLGSLAVEQLLGPARKVKVGQILKDPGILSTSTSEAQARSFFNVSPKNVLMTVRLPKGAKALDISKYSDNPGEAETLVASGSKMKVVKFDPKSRKLEVELLPHDYQLKTDAVAKDSAVSSDEESKQQDSRFVYNDATGLILYPSEDPNAEEFDLN